MTPLVSVVIPVFNGERFLAQALESVLRQTYPRVEAIVVDDGSEDGSAAIVESYAAVRLLRRVNGGVAAARNQGIHAAYGELVALLDQDDRWRPDKLALQVQALTERPEIGFVLAHVRTFLEAGTARPAWLRERDLLEDVPGWFPGTLLARRSCFEAVGGFDETFMAGGDDVDWFARAKDAGVGWRILAEALLERRIHGRNRSGEGAGGRDLLRALRRSIIRRRAMGDAW